jgi:hypothetical protein
MATTPYDEALELQAGSRKVLALSRELLASRQRAKRDHDEFLATASQRIARSRALLAMPVYAAGQIAPGKPVEDGR